MAAHLEGKAFSTIDQFGMAQKGGAVTSHVRIAAGDDQLGPARLSMGAADLILGCDSLVTCGDLALATIDPARTHVLVNTHQAITGQFAMNPDLSFPADSIESRIRAEAGSGRADLIDASRLATALLGDSIMSNMFMLGYAYQKGLLPVSSLALMRAIELNGHAIESNKAAFEWGRRTGVNPAAVAAIVSSSTDQAPETLEALITDLMAELTKYQDAAYAARYEAVVRRVASAEAERTTGLAGLATTVARNLFKLMAYKDEYEVARLYSEPQFREQLAAQFDNLGRIEVMLAPPVLARRDAKTGQLRKMTFGPWIFPVLARLARLKWLRGKAWDPFGWTEERRTERALISDYETIVDELAARLSPDNHTQAVAIAAVPEKVRGFGHVKAPAVAAARTEWQQRMAQFRTGRATAQAAE
jgi:indolepyruvate ferredoxin oxidoreductase